MKSLTKSTIQKCYRPRETGSHKGDHGHAFLHAGRKGMMGCALIAAKACLRSGTGLLTVSVPASERGIFQTALPEAMLHLSDKHPVPWERFTAAAIGPGIGIDKKAARALLDFLDSWTGPAVLDADALTLLSLHPELLLMLPDGAVLTPHVGEFDRLFGTQSSMEQRIETAMHVAQKYRCVIVLKSAHTVITFDGQIYQNTTGNAGLAKGGSGDALTGIITGLLAQGYPPFDAAKLGVWLHGTAADLALKQQSVESMLITDVIEKLGESFDSLIK